MSPDADQTTSAETSEIAGIAPDPAPWVVCDAVSRAHGSGPTRVVAVDEVSCRVGRGARVALCGPSGSGKSSVLHLMAGLDTPTSGRVRWPALGDPAGRSGTVGVVFQGPSLIPDLDVTENVALPLLLGPRSENDAPAPVRARQVLASLGLAELGDQLPEELSGGQAQRVAVARVLVTRPRLILADEPTGQLDRDTGDHVVSVLLAAADELDAALVVATHDPRVAERLDEQWQMRDGRLDTPVAPDIPGARGGSPASRSRWGASR